MVVDINEKYSGYGIADKCNKSVVDVLNRVAKILERTIEGMSDENFKQLKKAYKDVEAINRDTKELKDTVSITISKLEENSIETGHYYVQVLDYLREIAHSITFITKPCLDHLDNHHKALLASQVKDLHDLSANLNPFIMEIATTIKTRNFGLINKAIEEQHELIAFLDIIRKNQIKRIKANEVGTRNSMLYLNLLAESKNLLLQLINLVKAQRDFFEFISGNSKA